MISFTLEDFIRESNMIEGIVREPTESEIVAHELLFSVSPISSKMLLRFIRLCEPGAVLRNRPGMDVRVGEHFPPCGGSDICDELDGILDSMDQGAVGDAYELHHAYETLHPFTDCNGRSGRVLWLRMMGGIERAPLGFLHTWYYQSLQSGRKAK